MHLRSDHVERSLPALHALIRTNPLGVLTTAIPSPDRPTILSSHIPFLLDFPNDDSPGILRGHLARPNPQSKSMIASVSEAFKTIGSTSNGSFLEQEVMVLFTSPIQHYVTPKFYTTTKPTTGKVVPTWNYAAAQAYGRAKIFFDPAAPETVAFLSKQIADLSRMAEEEVMGFDGREGRKEAWEVSDAPERYIEVLMKGIIGVEIHVERLEGKFKMSQELGKGDRQGVIEGFKDVGGDVGRGMAARVRERGEMRDRDKAEKKSESEMV